jgi:hypothetical protein
MAPVVTLSDTHLVYSIPEVKGNGNREPLGPVGGFDSIAILPFVLFELDIVEENENIGAVQLVEESEPGSELRLMGGKDQDGSSSGAQMFVWNALCQKQDGQHEKSRFISPLAPRYPRVWTPIGAT